MHRKRLVLGNFDNGIQLPSRLFVANIDGAFMGNVTGALALKCIEVSPRAVHLVDEGEAAVLYEALPPSYARYFEWLYGYSPRVLHPQMRYTDLSERLCLLEWILADQELTDQIRALGLPLDPFIGHPLNFEIARRAGVEVLGLSEAAVLAGAVGNWNDKAMFQRLCHELDIPVVPSVHVTGWEELVAEASRQYEQDGAVMLRRSRAAGGLGNCEVNAEILSAAGCATVQAYLEQVLEPRLEWGREVVLVEPVLEIVASPTTLFHAVRGQPARLICVADQVVERKCFLGSEYPSAAAEHLQRQMIAQGEAYAEEFVRAGGEGYFDIDWGITGEGALVAFESNTRYTGNNHCLAAMRRLGAEDAFGWSNDGLPVSASTTFEAVDNFLHGADAHWNSARGDGVVITIPPAGVGAKKTLGCLALAQTPERRSQLRELIRRFAQSTF